MNNLDLKGIAFDHEEDHDQNNQPSTSTTFQNLKNLYGTTFTTKENFGGVDDEEAITEELSTINSQIQQLEENSFGLEALDELSNDPTGARIMNEILTSQVSDMIAKVETALGINRQKQKNLLARRTAMREAQEKRRKIPSIQQYLPPYFKDEFGYCAPNNDEAREKDYHSRFDPLEKEEKKWTPAEVTRFKAYVRRALLEVHLGPLQRKREDLLSKIKQAGADASVDQVKVWRDDFNQTERKIQFQSELSLDDLTAIVDANEVDWIKVANIDFGGQRSPFSLRLKWFNEVSPRWNQAPWTKEEQHNLKAIVDQDPDNILWTMVAEKLGTNRTPWQCFEKYKSELFQTAREWTTEEDEKLVTLANVLKVGGNVQWEKVAYYMPGRTRQQVRVRFSRTLDKNVKHGKWSEQEDLLLMCQVNRYGAKNWIQIAKGVPGRTDVQCRERWSSVLDKRTITREWSIWDDEKLIFLVNRLGRNSWAKCANFMDGRTGDQCRYRFQSLLNQKIKVSLNQKQLKSPEEMTDYEMRATMKKLRLNRLYRKYDSMMYATGMTAEFFGPKEAGDLLMESVEMKEKEGKQRAQNSRSKVGYEEMQAIQRDLKKMEERRAAGENVILQDLLNLIQVEGNDLINYNRRRKNTKFLKDDKQDKTADSRKGRKVQLRKGLAEDPAIKERHDAVIESDLPEQEKIDELHDILVDTVTRMDAHEFSMDFSKSWKEAGSAIAEDLMKNMIKDTSMEDLKKISKGEPLGFQTTLPVNWGNCDFYTKLQKARPALLKNAIELFARADTSIDDPYYPYDYEPSTSMEPSVRLFIRLSKEITESEGYLRTKAFLRNVLIEPMIFEAATLTAKQHEDEIIFQQNWQCREMEEKDLLEGRRKKRTVTLEELRERNLKVEVVKIADISTKSPIASTKVEKDRVQQRRQNSVDDTVEVEDELAAHSQRENSHEDCGIANGSASNSTKKGAASSLSEETKPLLGRRTRAAKAAVALIKEEKPSTSKRKRKHQSESSSASSPLKQEKKSPTVVKPPGKLGRS